MLTVIWFILIGAVIGLLARLVVPGRNPMGVLLTILVGIVGAVLGGVVAGAVGAGSILAFIFSVVIAAILVALLSGVGGRRHRAL
ncbi:GlsB/YeaQ/YmgE family stress response membrane protein [Actinoallomurus acaciae]|uniref:GlsB/YeaQ/YmgE family stress response membrane protein n=1 Tax=Actinoallomurus acaciae TaxID=502577 RepID=A0ABV5YAH6_9ACTN